MVLIATLEFEEGNFLLFDGDNAFNSIHRHIFMPVLAEIVSSVIP